MHPLDAPKRDLTHALTPHFEAIKRFKSLKALQSSPLYRDIGPEIERVINGTAWRNTVHTDQNPDIIRVVAWNIERGLKLDGIIHLLKTHPILSKADILLITEADIGMGRTQNRNIPEELADACAMNYVFANCFLALEKGDIGEQHHNTPNTLSLHGIAILSRFPIQSHRTIYLPMFKDVFNDLEKRLGSRKGLICTISINNRPLDFCVTHIELATSPPQRGQQMAALLNALSHSPSNGILIGGDFNTTTYNLRSKKHLFAHLAYKAFFGVPRIVEHYMNPARHFEKPLFHTLATHGYDLQNCNALTSGTLYYDINDQNVEAKIRQYRIPAFALRWLRRKLSPWNGRVPLRLDWFATKHLTPLQTPHPPYAPPQVVDTPLHNNTPVSDHSPIVLDLHV